MSSVSRTPSSSTRIKSASLSPTARAQGSATVPFESLSCLQLQNYLGRFPQKTKEIHERLIEKQPEEIKQAYELGQINAQKGALAFQNLALRNLRGQIMPQNLEMAFEMAIEALKLHPQYGAATLLQLAKAYAQGDFKIKKDTLKALKLILKAAIINPEAAGRTLKELSPVLKIKGLSQSTLEEQAFTLENRCKKIPLNTLPGGHPGFQTFFEAFIKKYLPEIYPQEETKRQYFFEQNYRPAVMSVIQDLLVFVD